MVEYVPGSSVTYGSDRRFDPFDSIRARGRRQLRGTLYKRKAAGIQMMYRGRYVRSRGQHRAWEKRAARIALAAAVGLGMTRCADAAPIQGTWVGGGHGFWSSAANWANGVVPGKGADDTVSFTGNATPNHNDVTVDSAITAGTFNFDRPGGFKVFQPSSGTIPTVTFLSTSGNAAINVTGTSGTNSNSFVAPMVLGS